MHKKQVHRIEIKCPLRASRCKPALEATTQVEALLGALVVLYAMEPVVVNAGDLPWHAELSGTSMTRVLDVLERMKWISCVHVGKNRREIHVSLTDRGREFTGTFVHGFIQRACETGADLSTTGIGPFKCVPPVHGRTLTCIS